MSGGIPGPILLDADPRAPLGATRGQRRAVGRDPFAPAPDEAAWRDALLGLQEQLGVAALGRGNTRARRRIDEIAEHELPEGLVGLLGDDVRRRLAALAEVAPTGRKGDPFGYQADAFCRSFPFFYGMHRLWFRVVSEGGEQVPSEGPAILAANHGGLLPFDGAMAIVDVLMRTDPPRLLRALVDRWVRALPGVRGFFARTGQVPATRKNLRTLLGRDELVLVFPEGLAGIRKTVPNRYRLEHFHTGFVEEALRLRVPIVPVAIAGPEDQAPILYDLQPLARRLGLPTLPITPTFPWLGPLGLVPYPVRYRIRYGAPIRLHEVHPPEAAQDRALVTALAGDLRRTIQHQLDCVRR